jgi:hypothetical protein
MAARSHPNSHPTVDGAIPDASLLAHRECAGRLLPPRDDDGAQGKVAVVAAAGPAPGGEVRGATTTPTT